MAQFHPIIRMNIFLVDFTFRMHSAIPPSHFDSPNDRPKRIGNNSNQRIYLCNLLSLIPFKIQTPEIVFARNSFRQILSICYCPIPNFLNFWTNCPIMWANFRRWDVKCSNRLYSGRYFQVLRLNGSIPDTNAPIKRFDLRIYSLEMLSVCYIPNPKHLIRLDAWRWFQAIPSNCFHQYASLLDWSIFHDSIKWLWRLNTICVIIVRVMVVRKPSKLRF